MSNFFEAVTNTKASYESLLATSEKTYIDFLIKLIESIKCSKIKDKYDIIQGIYQHILKTHLYSLEIFTEKTRSFFFEQDYIVEFWGYLIETMFRSTQIFPHWGDTISPFSSKLGILAKMDLRLLELNDEDDLEKSLDVGNAEFAKKETETKYYKDLLKSVLSSKIHLNELVKDFPGMTQETIKIIKMPFCVAAATTCYVYTLRLESRNLYLVEDACTMTIPLSLKVIKEGSILKLVKNLMVLKSISLDINSVLKEKQALISAAKIPVITKNKKNQESHSALNWCKKVWIPLPMDNDGEEDDN